MKYACFVEEIKKFITYNGS